MERAGRFVPITGILFAALVVAGIFTVPNTPNSDASGARVITFYTAHRSSQKASSVALVFAAVFFIFFVGSLYGFLRRAPAAHTLATVGLGGAFLFALGFAIFAGVGFALADVPNRLTPGAAQALNVLDNDLFFPLAIGSVVFGIGIGLAIVRSGLLPVWLGWVVLVLGILSVPLFPLYFALLLWTVVVSILMYLRLGEPGGTEARASSAPPGPVAPA